jgi:hypothetical protein
MSCEVCAAPALPVDGRCVFCHSPLDAAEPAPAGLLDYLATRVPGAAVRRAGLLRRGRVTRFEVSAGGRRFRAGVTRTGLALTPQLPVAEWVDALLRQLSRVATRDVEVRARVSRAGWAPR